MAQKLYHCCFNTIQGKISLDGLDPFKVAPRAQILFTQNEGNEIEVSIHFDPPIVEDNNPVPGTHQMAIRCYTQFIQALQDLQT